MGFLSHLFHPWGFIVQILALVLFFRRRADTIWLWIILIGGFVGAAAFILVEVLPSAGLARQAFQSRGRKTRIAAVEIAIVDNPSVANLRSVRVSWDERCSQEESDHDARHMPRPCCCGARPQRPIASLESQGSRWCRCSSSLAPR